MDEEYNVSVDGQLDVKFKTLEEARKYAAAMQAEGFDTSISYWRLDDGKDTGS